MSVYKCNRCEWCYDDDYSECYEDRMDPLGLLCYDCNMNQENDVALEIIAESNKDQCTCRAGCNECLMLGE